jgi:hypothetical protein
MWVHADHGITSLHQKWTQCSVQEATAHEKLFWEAQRTVLNHRAVVDHLRDKLFNVLFDPLGRDVEEWLSMLPYGGTIYHNKWVYKSCDMSEVLNMVSGISGLVPIAYENQRIVFGNLAQQWGEAHVKYSCDLGVPILSAISTWWNGGSVKISYHYPSRTWLWKHQVRSDMIQPVRLEQEEVWHSNTRYGIIPDQEFDSFTKLNLSVPDPGKISNWITYHSIDSKWAAPVFIIHELCLYYIKAVAENHDRVAQTFTRKEQFLLGKNLAKHFEAKDWSMSQLALILIVIMSALTMSWYVYHLPIPTKCDFCAYIPTDWRPQYCDDCRRWIDVIFSPFPSVPNFIDSLVAMAWNTSEFLARTARNCEWLVQHVYTDCQSLVFGTLDIAGRIYDSSVGFMNFVSYQLVPALYHALPSFEDISSISVPSPSDLMSSVKDGVYAVYEWFVDLTPDRPYVPMFDLWSLLSLIPRAALEEWFKRLMFPYGIFFLSGLESCGVGQ